MTHESFNPTSAESSTTSEQLQAETSEVLGSPVEDVLVKIEAERLAAIHEAETQVHDALHPEAEFQRDASTARRRLNNLAQRVIYGVDHARLEVIPNGDQHVVEHVDRQLSMRARIESEGLANIIDRIERKQRETENRKKADEYFKLVAGLESEGFEPSQVLLLMNLRDEFVANLPRLQQEIDLDNQRNKAIYDHQVARVVAHNAAIRKDLEDAELDLRNTVPAQYQKEAADVLAQKRAVNPLLPLPKPFIPRELGSPELVFASRKKFVKDHDLYSQSDFEAAKQLNVTYSLSDDLHWNAEPAKPKSSADADTRRMQTDPDAIKKTKATPKATPQDTPKAPKAEAPKKPKHPFDWDESMDGHEDELMDVVADRFQMKLLFDYLIPKVILKLDKADATHFDPRDLAQIPLANPEDAAGVVHTLQAVGLLGKKYDHRHGGFEIIGKSKDTLKERNEEVTYLNAYLTLRKATIEAERAEAAAQAEADKPKNDPRSASSQPIFDATTGHFTTARRGPVVPRMTEEEHRAFNRSVLNKPTNVSTRRNPQFGPDSLIGRARSAAAQRNPIKRRRH